MTLYYELCRKTSTSPAQPILTKFGTINKLILSIEDNVSKSGSPGGPGISLPVLQEFQALFESYYWILGKHLLQT